MTDTDWVLLPNVKPDPPTASPSPIPSTSTKRIQSDEFATTEAPTTTTKPFDEGKNDLEQSNGRSKH